MFAYNRSYLIGAAIGVGLSLVLSPLYVLTDGILMNLFLWGVGWAVFMMGQQ